LLFALILGIVSQWFYSFIPLIYEDYPLIMATWGTVIPVVSLIINPIAILVVFYRVGKKYDLRGRIKEAILSILLGWGIGYFLTTIAGIVISYYVFHSTIYFEPLSILALIIIPFYQSVFPFFVTLASLALGYLRQNQS
jgi:hypothetical protein